MARTREDWLVAVDAAAATLLVLAAVPLLAVGISGDAGPFGAAVIPTVLFLLPGVPLLVVALLARPFRAASGRSGRWLAGGAMAFALAVASLPAGEAVREWRADRAVTRYGERLDAAAEQCTRDGSLATAVRCIEGDADLQPIVCNVTACWTSRREWSHASHDTVGVDLQPYLARDAGGDGIWYGR